MRCRNCDYPLWNITTRVCPECGSKFRPSDYEFTPSSVRFCCPHCDEAYYGMGHRGHLEPRSFACAKCGQFIRQGQMVVRPVAGVDEADTRQISAPWIDRRGDSRWHAFLRTTGLALTQPHRLMRGVPVQSSTVRAVVYAMLITGAAWLVALIPMLAMFFAAPFALGGLGGGITLSQAMIVGVVQVLVMFLFLWICTLIFIVIWTGGAHLILLMLGGASESIGRTGQALCYSAGANIVTGFPCVGYLVGPLWWVVSAVFMLREAHRTTVGRAITAVIVVPLLLIALSVIAYIAWLMYLLSSTTGPFAQIGQDPGRGETRLVRDRLVASVRDDGVPAPRHGVELVLAPTGLGPGNFIATDWLTRPADVPIADGTLAELQETGPNRRAMLIEAAAAALPADVIAHRVGDFVFVHHGIPLDGGDPDLWLVVLAPDPVANVNAPEFVIHAGPLAGAIEVIDANQRAAALAEQNALRAAAGFAPLPDPFDVTHDAPATGVPTAEAPAD